MLRYAYLTLVILLGPAAASGQETYKIELKKAPKGATVRVEKTETESQSLKVTDKVGQGFNEIKDNSIKAWVYDETVLERPDTKKKATSLKRAYQKAAVTRDKETTVLAYQGKTVLIDLKDGKYLFRIEGGGELTGDAAKYLDDEFNKERGEFDLKQALIPRGAVAVNEIWKLQMPELLDSFEKDTKLSPDREKSSGTAKLLQVFNKDGRQYGDLLVNLDFLLKSLASDQGQVPLNPGSVVKMEMKLSACIDGSLEDWDGRVTIQFNGTAMPKAGGNPAMQIEFAVIGSIEGGAHEVTKK